MEEQKQLSMLETVDKMIKTGDFGLVMLKNSITELEILDRLGKRMMVIDNKVANDLGKAQKSLQEKKAQLTLAEKTQEALKRLRSDLVADPLSVVD